MPETAIRPAAGADVAVLADLAGRTFVLACPPSVTPEAVEAFVAAHLTEAAFEQYLSDPDRTVLVAERDGRLIGYAMLIAGSPPGEIAVWLSHSPTQELSKIYLDPGAHGGGAGAGLMEASLRAAAEAGAAGVWLGTNQENVRALRFYEKSGFAIVGTRRFRVGDRLEDDYVLEYVVPAPR